MTADQKLRELRRLRRLASGWCRRAVVECDWGIRLIRNGRETRTTFETARQNAIAAMESQCDSESAATGEVTR